MLFSQQQIHDYNHNVSYGLSTAYDNPGNIIYPVGFTRSNFRTPVIFVHGITGKLTGSYQANVNQVISNNINAAFVQLEPLGSTIDNGKLLRRMIDRIRHHYNAATVSIVAHSRGGMDIERLYMDKTLM